MSEKIRFPSGATVGQVKKDAKTIKRERNIPHHEALNIAARKHGLDIGWGEAQAALGNRHPLVTLTYQCELVLPLTAQRPLGVILGPTGCDKYAIAAEICFNLLNAGGSVVNLIPDFKSYSTIPGYIADAMGMSSSKVGGFSSQAVQAKKRVADLFADIAPTPGTLIVMDEPQTLDDFFTESICNACINWQVGFLCLVQDGSATTSVSKDRVSMIIDASELQGVSRSVSLQHWEGKNAWQSLLLPTGGKSHLFDRFTIKGTGKA